MKEKQNETSNLNIASRSHNHDLPPVESDIDGIARRSTTSYSGSAPLINYKLCTRRVSIGTTYIWIAYLTILRLVTAARPKEDAVAISATDENDEFLMTTETMWYPYVEMQRTISTALYIFQVNTLHRDLGVMVETRVFSLLEADNHEAAKG